LLPVLVIDWGSSKLEEHKIRFYFDNYFTESILS